MNERRTLWSSCGKTGRIIIGLAQSVIIIGCVIYLYPFVARYFDGNRSAVSTMKKGTNFTTADPARSNSNIRSPQHLIKLAEMEENIFKIIGEYSEVLRENLRLLDEYRKDYEESSLKGTTGLDQSQVPEAISKNPIMAYRMIRRYAKTLRHLYAAMGANANWEKLIRDEAGKYEMSEWPTDIDLDDANDAMVRMHDVYDFELSEFTSGNLMGVQTHAELKASDCQEIGEFATHRLKHYSSGVLWLEAALNKTDKSSEPEKFAAITNSLKNATETHDIAWKNKTYWDHKFFQKSLNETPAENRKSLRKVHYEERKGKQNGTSSNALNFWGLCSGENHQTKEAIADLFCWHETKSNPAWVISPLKVEQLSRKPYLIQIYDVLTHKTIQAMKDVVIPKLRRSKIVHSTKAYDDTLSNSRTSVGSSLERNSHISRNLARYVELMTGLFVVPEVSSEVVMIASYAFGGHYDCHLDAFPDLHVQIQKGNRIATMMFYLEDVEVGGLTAFPNIGTATRPVKGSAVFWYNLHKNGERHFSTYHGACPVVLGHKWIATKWIYVNAQLLTRPCGMSSTE